mgnify:CR=1 FL=1
MSSSPEGTNYLNYPKGWKSWLTTLDHKRIGIMYLVTTLVFFLVGGIYAILVRLEHWTPGQTIMSADAYNKAFTYHGSIMVFMVIIPMIPAAMGNFVLPLMLGAKDVAFPRLNLLSYYVFITGAVMALLTLALKGVDTGWTFYAPFHAHRNFCSTHGIGCFCDGIFFYLNGAQFHCHHS